MSRLGDAFQFVALMWFAVVAAGPLGVLAVRAADNVPAILFGLHGGGAADRRDRRRTMIAADLVRGAVLVPVAVGGITGHLPLWGLVLAAFVLTTAASYFMPAFGAFLPSLVGRENVQQANGLVSATNGSISVVALALAAGLLAFMSIGAFFALNAASFLLSAALLAGVQPEPPAPAPETPVDTRLRLGFAALRPHPGLAAAVVMYGAGSTVVAGVWIIGVAQIAHTKLGLGATGLALIMAANAVGMLSAGAMLARSSLRRKTLWSCAAWLAVLPGFVLLGLAGSLAPALAGAVVTAAASGAGYVLVSAAVQEAVPDTLLGRAMGVLYLAQVGGKAVGLLAIAPLYAVFDPATMFVAGGIVLAALGAAAVVATRAVPTSRGAPVAARDDRTRPVHRPTGRRPQHRLLIRRGLRGIIQLRGSPVPRRLWPTPLEPRFGKWHKRPLLRARAGSGERRRRW